MSSRQVAKVLELQPQHQSLQWMSIQDCFPLGLTGWISLQSKGLLRVFSSITVWNRQFLVLSLLYSPALTSIHDYWKNHSFDDMDLCQQSNVSVFYYTGCFYISKYLWVQMCDFLSNLSLSHQIVCLSYSSSVHPLSTSCQFEHPNS